MSASRKSIQGHWIGRIGALLWLCSAVLAHAVVIVGVEPSDGTQALSETNWKAILRLSGPLSDGAGEVGFELGIDPAATDLFDIGLDEAAPPPHPDPEFPVAWLFNDADPDPLRQEYRRDLRAFPGDPSAGVVWTLNVDNSSNPNEWALEWDLSLLPAPWNFAKIEVGGLVYDMWTTTALPVPAQSFQTYTMTFGQLINTAPSFDFIPDQSVSEDGSLTVEVTNIAPGTGPLEVFQAVTITATSSDPSVVPDPTVVGFGSTVSLQIVPVPDAVGTVTITVTAVDDGPPPDGTGHENTFSQAFALNITPVNDPPTIAAVADLTVDEDSGPTEVPLTVSPGGGSDEAGQVLSFEVLADNPDLLSLAEVVFEGGYLLRLEPAPDAFGSTQITVTVTDDDPTDPLSAGTTFLFTVNPINDAPSAQDAFLEVDEDGSGSVSVFTLVSDPDGDALTVEIVTPPSDGTAFYDPDTALLTYTPVADFFGTDSFTYRASDGQLDSNEATVSVTVNPINDAPSAQDAFLEVDEDGSGSVSVFTLVSDPDGDALTVEIVTPPSNGTAFYDPDTALLTYTPVADFFGTDSFTYRASDGQLDSNEATVSVTVNPINDAPLAFDLSLVVEEGGAGSVPVAMEDPDGDALSVVIVAGPIHGTANFDPDSGLFTYVPVAGFSGEDSFQYLVTDGQAESNLATVTITVTPAVVENTPPTAGDLSLVTFQNVPGTVTAAIFDPDGDPTDGGDRRSAASWDGELRPGDEYVYVCSERGFCRRGQLPVFRERRSGGQQRRDGEYRRFGDYTGERPARCF
ncbi:MAG: hypothetical protein KatS3mg115_1417 [Candidatus Poribacteria bacterium]|nr:MAG: hypothetical protein KatS3mg115_1417 [Candidatus Poribacteria bacterium]